MLKTVSTVNELRAAILEWRKAGETVALVPTMGALHKGHLSLVEQARKTADRVVASIFVNLLQFGPQEDLAKYPRTPDADKKFLADHGCDLLFMPSTEDMYPHGFATEINPGPLATTLEGVFRPGHFVGVATVVVKLLLQAMPDAAFFGEKDYQQFLVIRRVVRDLNLPVHIVPAPIVREDDGLACSSRNVYLSPEDRKRAVMFPDTLKDIVVQIKSGALVEATLRVGYDRLTAAGFGVDYLELADPHTLAPMRELTAPARLLSVVRIGGVRLLDNWAV